ncbi:transcriptional repressor [Pseudodesulfovibrio sp. zrk46]|uniref:Fur family transcriptional regulator n=1 Tax=Pseudodesulfovibrio sp. zrk46 TaxID=2725288 RepID=UPI0014491C4A|nr:transcriptional repressor [Pseudodesulfovibrio sp. zrk46]QJB57209.1 transcriptional repressor [Pseudodesulfovibrio sp. zrk46]
MKDDKSTASSHSLLKTMGLRPTLNRVLVLDTIASSDKALTAREIFEGVTKEHNLNRVTVYRTLETLFDNGAINRTSCGDRIQHFCIGKTHSHFHCTECGEVKCIDNKELQFDEHSVMKSLPMQINSINLQLEGICDKCSHTL